MLNTDVLIHRNRMALAFKISCCILAGSLLFGCGPSEDAVSTANNPSPNATTASPSVASNTNEYSIGNKINFGADGNSKAFKVSGWSDAEAKHSWTNGVVSVLVMRLPARTKPISLKMKLAGLTKDPEVPSQPVEVYVNDQKIADWDVRELAMEYTAPIPPSITKDEGLLTITLKIPKAVSPKSLGIGEDSRLLGLACMEVSLSPTQ
jgi:hypothetical protein